MSTNRLALLNFPSGAIFSSDEIIDLRLVGALHLLDVPLDLAADTRVLCQVPGQGHGRERAGRISELGI
jgi:hypothetical protein